MENKMKTSELTGAALDWAVAKCEGTENTWGKSRLKPYELYKGRPYSTDWQYAGGIIEKHIVCVNYSDVERIWAAYAKQSDSRFVKARGKTVLEAAMRCYVASKLGDEVTIPEELQ